MPLRSRARCQREFLRLAEQRRVPHAPALWTKLLTNLRVIPASLFLQVAQKLACTIEKFVGEGDYCLVCPNDRSHRSEYFISQLVLSRIRKPPIQSIYYSVYDVSSASWQPSLRTTIRRLVAKHSANPRNKFVILDDVAWSGSSLNDYLCQLTQELGIDKERLLVGTIALSDNPYRCSNRDWWGRTRILRTHPHVYTGLRAVSIGEVFTPEEMEGLRLILSGSSGVMVNLQDVALWTMTITAWKLPDSLPKTLYPLHDDPPWLPLFNRNRTRRRPNYDTALAAMNVFPSRTVSAWKLALPDELVSDTDSTH